MKNYIKIIALFGVAALLNAVSPLILAYFSSLGGVETSIAATLWVITLVLGFGWLCAEFSKGTIFPSFTLQLLISIFLHDALAPLSSEITMIVVICTVLAAVILKSGGDEVERRLFGKIALPTILIAIVGYLITFFVTFWLMLAVGIDGKTAALLSAIIGSTDPAALIPTLKRVVFKKQHQKLVDISVAESALNDAVGAIFTGAVIAMIHSGASVGTVGGIFSGVTESHNLTHLGEQLLFGIIAGVVGWGIMWLYEKHKSTNHETSYDFAVILAVPVFSFLLAQSMHGNGFLAAFIAGLLADYNHKNHGFRRTLEVMETKIESIGKPVIFMMVGPLISLSDLWQTAGYGLIVSLLFIFVARPIAVFVSLAFTKISMKEKLFLCVVRETGVIPVVLAVVAVSQFAGLTTLLPLVAWVVIWTLTLLPSITPWWAKVLGLTETQKEKTKENERNVPELVQADAVLSQ